MEAINNTNLHPELTTKLFMASVVDILEPTHKSYSNSTGRFPVYSGQGNLYVLVIYLYNTNANLIEPMKNCCDTEQLQAHCTVVQCVSQTNAKTPWDGQQSIHSAQGPTNQGIQYGVSIGPTTHPLQKRSGKSHSNV
jgi:hypothetical protein